MNNYQIVGGIGVILLLVQVVIGFAMHFNRRTQTLPKPTIILVIGPYLAGKSKLVCCYPYCMHSFLVPRDSGEAMQFIKTVSFCII